MSTTSEPPWILWAHDPCPEGGWSIQGEFGTREEAVEAAKALHASWEKRHQAMVEFIEKGPDRPKDLGPWKRENNCYDKCVVTGGQVFEIGWPKGEKPEEFKPVQIEGEPLSETIKKERR